VGEAGKTETISMQKWRAREGKDLKTQRRNNWKKTIEAGASSDISSLRGENAPYLPMMGEDRGDKPSCFSRHLPDNGKQRDDRGRRDVAKKGGTQEKTYQKGRNGGQAVGRAQVPPKREGAIVLKLRG